MGLFRIRVGACKKSSPLFLSSLGLDYGWLLWYNEKVLF